MTAQTRNNRVSWKGTISVKSHGRDIQISCFPRSFRNNGIMLHDRFFYLYLSDMQADPLLLKTDPGLIGTMIHTGQLSKNRSCNQPRLEGSMVPDMLKVCIGAAEYGRVQGIIVPYPDRGKTSGKF